MIKKMLAATYDLKKKSGYLKLNDEAIDRSLQRTRPGRGCEHVRLTAEW